MSIRRFTFSNPKVTVQEVDDTNHFNWICFAKEDGLCRIQKVSATDLSQIFYNITKEVDNINAASLNSSNIYLAYEDSTLFGERLSLTNPLTSTTEISIPDGILESPADIKVGTDVYFLTPGNLSGTVANVVRYSTAGVFQEIIELSKSGLDINNASSLTIDANDNIWIITNESPSRYIRLFDQGGFNWDFESYDAV